MRIVFSSTPALGHLLPMLPLAASARRAGHEVAVLSHPSVASVVVGMPLLPAGPSVPEALEDVSHRTAVDAMRDRAAGPVEFFVESRMGLGAEAALAAAAGFAPGLVVADMVDYLGPFAAAALGVPWAAHGAALPLDPRLAAALDQAAAAHFAHYGVTPAAPVAYVDPWPDSLLSDGRALPAGRIAIRPEPHSDESSTWSRPRFADREDRPLILVTLGTVVDDRAALAAILDSLAPLDVNVIAAPLAAAGLGGRRVDSTRLRLAGFVPMKQLLQGVDVVVSSAGAGTVLSALSAGRPMVLLPMGLDKPVNAQRAAAAGAAVVIDAADQAGAAVQQVLADQKVTDCAAKVAEEIAAMNSPDEVLKILLSRLG
jgi:UDP:flavonoid glycosyltransferase YjiC (YdhE family)